MSGSRRWCLVLTPLLVAALVAGGMLGGNPQTTPQEWAAASRAAADSSAAGPAAIGRAAPDAAAGGDRRGAAASDSRRHPLELVLQARADAVLGGDRQAWMATVDPTRTAFVAQQGQVFDHLGAVPLSSWRYGVAAAPVPLPTRPSGEVPGRAWRARVVLSVGFEGVTGVVRQEQEVTLVEREGGWLLTAARVAVPQLWDLGPVAVARGKRSLVLGTAAHHRLEALAAESDRAAAYVDQVWGTAWSRTVVVLVPRDPREMAALLQRDGVAGLDQVAAVTTGEVPAHRGPDAHRPQDDVRHGGAITDVVTSDVTTTDRVVVNPEAFDRLGVLGRQVVLTHEVTHVATRAETGAEVPLWLSEGLADYVAYLPAGVAPDVVSADVLDQVRRGQTPVRLPADPDFDPTLTTFGSAYAGAWFAADLIADQHGQQALLDLYRAAAGGPAGPGGEQRGVIADAGPQERTARAFREVLGVTLPAFEQQWREHLERVAG